MILFFRTLSKSVIAVECDCALSQQDSDKLCWLFGEAKPESEDDLSGYFVGPRREMITPWIEAFVNARKWIEEKKK